MIYKIYSVVPKRGGRKHERTNAEKGGQGNRLAVYGPLFPAVRLRNRDGGKRNLPHPRRRRAAFARRAGHGAGDSAGYGDRADDLVYRLRSDFEALARVGARVGGTDAAAFNAARRGARRAVRRAKLAALSSPFPSTSTGYATIFRRFATCCCSLCTRRSRSGWSSSPATWARR